MGSELSWLDQVLLSLNLLLFILRLQKFMWANDLYAIYLPSRHDGGLPLEHVLSSVNIITSNPQDHVVCYSRTVFDCLGLISCFGCTYGEFLFLPCASYKG